MDKSKMKRLNGVHSEDQSWSERMEVLLGRDGNLLDAESGCRYNNLASRSNVEKGKWSQNHHPEIPGPEWVFKDFAFDWTSPAFMRLRLFRGVRLALFGPLYEGTASQQAKSGVHYLSAGL